MTGIISDNVGRPSGLIKAASGGGGVWTLIKTLTSDGSDSDLTFVNGTDDVVLDSTYPIYRFVFINIHPETAETELQMSFRDGGSAFDAIKTTTLFLVSHTEDDSATSLAYNTVNDMAQGTGFLNIMKDMSGDSDASGSGYLELFSPSDTTFVKHFIAEINYMHFSPQTIVYNIAGYCNTTTAIDGVQFKMASGEIQGGKIKLYGLKDSA